MGLDMYIDKYNKKMDKKTFEKVVIARDINVQYETNFVNFFEEIENEKDKEVKTEKFLNFCETYLNNWTLDRLKKEPLSIHELKSIMPGKDYKEYLYEFKSKKEALVRELYKELDDKVESAKKAIKIYEEVEDILIELGDNHEVAYWRKHSDLNGYMEDLYREKGGEEEEFNCVPLYLTKEDIERIIRDHKRHLDEENDFTIGESRGFFWGATNQEDWEDSLKDFEKILEETDWDNETVYYSCWY